MTDSQKAALEILEYLDSDSYAGLLESSCWQEGHPSACGHVLTQPLSVLEAKEIACERIREIIDRHLC